MLSHEIEPYADEHMKRLRDLKKEIDSYIYNTIQRPDPRVLMDWAVAVDTAERGFYRFKVCMVDEVEQKERYRQTLRDHKIRPNLKASP